LVAGRDDDRPGRKRLGEHRLGVFLLLGLLGVVGASALLAGRAGRRGLVGLGVGSLRVVGVGQFRLVEILDLDVHLVVELRLVLRRSRRLRAGLLRGGLLGRSGGGILRRLLRGARLLRGGRLRRGGLLRGGAGLRGRRGLRRRRRLLGGCGRLLRSGGGLLGSLLRGGRLVDGGLVGILLRGPLLLGRRGSHVSP